ncbi:MAG: AAA family ATPase [Chloroflexota bacterium]|nr:AAA family ATPase [Chloroflexota bacterium]
MQKLTTGIPGLDALLDGGVVRGSQVLVVGPTGAGKTILAAQMVFHHARQGRRALWLTALTEASSKLIEHLRTLDYFDQSLLGDVVQVLNVQGQLAERGLDGTLSEILKEVADREIEVLVIDSVRSLYELAGDRASVQDFIFRLGSSLFQLGCTTLLVTDQSSLDTRVSLEAVISDTLLHLEVSMDGKREVRDLHVIKMRGALPLTGRHPFDITAGGIRVYPRIESLRLDGEEAETDRRLSWGVGGVDRLTGGGIPAYESTLVLGTTGIGKTTLALHYTAEGISTGDNCLYLSFHEKQQKALRKARAFGLELDAAVTAGSLRIMHVAPSDLDVDRVLHAALEDVEDREVSRLVIDTLNPLERDAARQRRFPDIIPALTDRLQARGVTTLITSELTQVLGQTLDLGSARESYWTPIDNIVLMRPVEMTGRIGRVLSVLKMRGSDHDEAFYSYDIGPRGIELEDALQGLEGLLTGRPYRSG